jgi:hypothetical protein
VYQRETCRIRMRWFLDCENEWDLPTKISFRGAPIYADWYAPREEEM